MSITIESLKKGDVLHDVHTYRMGNTTIRAEGHWLVHVKDVGRNDSGRPWADLSWNGNKAKRCWTVPNGYKRHPKEWLREDPISGGGRSCALCDGTEPDHHEDCEHPRAIAKRKRAAKAAGR